MRNCLALFCKHWKGTLSCAMPQSTTNRAFPSCIPTAAVVLESLVCCFGFKLVAHSRARSDLQEHRLCLARSVDVLEHLQRILRLVAA